MKLSWMKLSWFIFFVDYIVSIDAWEEITCKVERWIEALESKEFKINCKRMEYVKYSFSKTMRHLATIEKRNGLFSENRFGFMLKVNHVSYFLRKMFDEEIQSRSAT